MINKIKNWKQFINENISNKKTYLVYSGTDVENVNPSYSIYFAKDKSIASHFGNARAYYITMENPFILDFSNSWQDIDINTLYKKLGAEELFNLIKTQIGDGWGSLDNYFNDTPVCHDPIAIEDVVNYVKTYTNHDGLIFYNIAETTEYIKTDTYVIFNKNQAKLVG